MKKNTIKRAIAIIVATISFMMITAEADSIIGQILWTATWMTAFAISARIIEATMSKEEQEEEV